ncbi:MAG: AAA family ATPase [Candidatus Caldarchaeum sp.]
MLLVEILGEPAVGKTHLSLTFPNPFLFDTTPKREAEIIAYKLLGAEAAKRYEWVKNYQHLIKALVEVLQREDVKTIIIDTGADLQGMAVAYEIERKDRERLMPFEYGRIREMVDEDIIEKTIAAGKHLVLTAQMDDEYINGQKTGRRIPKGYKRLAFQADIRILLVVGSAEVQVMPGGTSFTVIPKPDQNPKRKTVIIKNRFVDMAETGYTVLTGNITYQNILELIPQNLRDKI